MPDADELKMPNTDELKMENADELRNEGQCKSITGHSIESRRDDISVEMPTLWAVFGHFQFSIPKKYLIINK
jgi:hypothetical protein